MKYVVVLYDGMADYPVDALGGKTPMEVAKKPLFDFLGARSEVGLVRTVADGLKPGSDIANMSVLGYNPSEYYTGRSPLEAVSIGVSMQPTDIIFRCNVVTLSQDEPYESKTMVDYSAGDISSAESAKIIQTIQEQLGSDSFAFYNGVSYRHCLVWHNGTLDLGDMTPPHDISGRVIGEYLLKSKNAAPLVDMMKKSCEILKNHPVNLERMREGKRPANAIWLWGEGVKPSLPSFSDIYGLRGSIISAVDLLKGIGKCAGMSVPEVEGATGYIDTNFTGKAQCALDELERGQDLVYIHLEAPDECGHRNEPENKVRSIELIDEKVLAVLLKGLEKYDDYKIMILPDHPTPIKTMTHARDPVPYIIYRKKAERAGVKSVTEATAAATGVFIENGPSIMRHFIED
ncbi:MAG: cofactor-independent phosphoglycerate mutase [Clostridiales bacterium]|nr:cofactor-independent phosphoglycerate mutase [Clostridiales bacterium]